MGFRIDRIGLVSMVCFINSNKMTFLPVILYLFAITRIVGHNQAVSGTSIVT